ncbi:efflux RND transporter periplasmic adaptor subunit [Marinimicrobium sp. ABcell2]|uniref:efflux RND transporter periplasmic adaptor subunit n=1 Tax=Marinimicrobium sp. ABcell2 TaxID=3069751 RepID=UPI0027B33DFF|nr:efflux RND transporter periplasmic adaptor subunit [Marinimicrobium sp. ABcell2]MDQ2078155.1 efflux RND transporter periplasmic adaptor subunit [Marinimicrobium sp. ABcell2]
MKRFLSLTGVVLLLGTFVGTTWFLYQKSQQDPVVYQTDTPYVTDIVTKTVAIGSIKPRREIGIKSQVSGVVDELFVEPGHSVERGDLIARIRLIPNMEHLNQAQSQLESARINFRNAERELQRQQRLFADKLISESEYNRFMLTYELQKEAVKAAENNVSLIREGSTTTADQTSNLVRATANGMILDVPVEEGVFVIESNTFNEGTTIASIADMTDLIFEGRVDESEVGKLREGMELLLNIGALDGERFTADLEYISPKGIEDQGTINFEIRAAIKLNPDFFLRAGYSANADIILDQREQVLAINEGNLLFIEGGTYVEVAVGDQRFERQRVRTGISDGINIEILDGLSENTVIKRL